MKKTICFLIVSSVFSSFVLAAEPDTRPVVEVPIVKAMPRIDADCSDAVWQQIPWQNDLVEAVASTPAQPPLKFKLAAYEKYLLIAVVSDHSDTSSLSREKSPRDEISFSETIEVFISPDPAAPAYYHFAFTPGGGIYDTLASATPTDYNYDVQYAVKITDTGWQLEAAIPLEEIGGDLAGGTEMDFNLCRSSKGSAGAAWSATGASFHARHRMGRIIVGSYEAAARRRIRHITAVAQGAKLSRDPKISGTINYLARRAAEIKTQKVWQDFDRRYTVLSERLSKKVIGDTPEFRVWEIAPWRIVPAESIAPKHASAKKISLKGFRGEFLTSVVCVANLSSSPVRSRVICSEISKEGEKQKQHYFDIVRVQRVGMLALQGGRQQRDPLSEINFDTIVDFRSHENEVIWLTIDTRNLTPGRYLFELVFKPTVKRNFEKKVQYELEILPGDFPKPGSGFYPIVYSYPYPRYKTVSGKGRSETYQKHAIDMLENYCETVWKIPNPITAVKVDEKGSLVEPRFESLDKALDELKERFGTLKGLYFITGVYWSRNQEILEENLGGKAFGKSVMRKNFKSYIEKYEARLKQHDVLPSQILWYNADEPNMQRARAVEGFYALLTEFAPQQRIFCTIYRTISDEVVQCLLPYVNLWCLSVSESQRRIDWLRKSSRKGTMFMSYSVNSRVVPVWGAYMRYTYHAMRRGYVGNSYWSFDDMGSEPGATVWDDFSGKKGRSHYATIYEGSQRPCSSVRLEAWRRGIQDWVLFNWLVRLAYEEGPETGKKAEAFRNNAIVQIISESHKNEFKTAYEYRERMRRMIVELLHVQSE